MDGSITTLEVYWLKKANAAIRRGSNRMMIPPNTVTDLLIELIESKKKLDKLHQAIGEDAFLNILNS